MKTPTVFYDLETSDKLFVGQILNFAFIEVDDDFNIRGEFCGEVKLSRLQLPSPDAILANRINVTDLQKQATFTEREAMGEIWQYLAGLIHAYEGPIKLIGYNSTKFDLPYLRTSFIRNGINPYFESKLQIADLLQLTRKLSVTGNGFPRKMARNGEEGKLSLSLESMGLAFDLIKGPQSHESRQDVLLTIELAKVYSERFGADIREFQAYEAQPNAPRGTVIHMLSPNYELEAPSSEVRTPAVLLDSDHRNSLWIDLLRFKKGEGRGSINWVSKSNGMLLQSPDPESVSAEEREIAEKALNEFKSINLKNFFTKSQCDIELDIYRLDFSAIEALRTAIWDKESKPLKSQKNPDLDAVFDRFRIANYRWGNGADDKVTTLLKQYALYRYGGRMHISKSRPDAKFEEGVFSPHFHPTYQELSERIDTLLGTAKETDRELLLALKDFYERSDIVRIAGPELKAIKRTPPAEKAA